MEFNIDTVDYIEIGDQELSDLLAQVYVEGGFTTPEEANSLFDPSSVRKRGILICARETKKLDLAGIVIIVPPTSPACRLAGVNETEMHLLGVKPEFRHFGLGGLLVEAGIETATQGGYKKLILWTQVTMKAAQRLYESKGFNRTQEFNRNGRDFWVYEKNLNDIVYRLKKQEKGEEYA